MTASSERPLADDVELRASLAGLSRLSHGRGQRGLETMLVHVAQLAVRAIPGADGAGLTLLEADRPDTIVATAPFVREVDAIQYGLGQGPCITAAQQGRTVTSGTLDTQRLWPAFGPRVARLGIHSVLSLPLLAADGVVGAMNVYAHEPHAFTARSIALGELFAVPAAMSVQNAKVLEQSRRLTDQLQSALSVRASIDQAAGIIMSRAGGTSGEALATIRRLSRTEDRPMATTAQRIVTEAARRATAARDERTGRGGL